jgi:hypothetical protein
MDETLKKEIADLIKATNAPIEANLKVIADTMAADRKTAEAQAATAAAAAKEAATAKEAAEKATADKAAAGAGDGVADKPIALTEADFNKRVAEAAGKLVDDRFKAQQTTAEQQASREAFVKNPENGLAKLPAEFAGRLGTDPAKWKDEARAAVGSFEKYLKDNNVKIDGVGGANREGGDTAAAEAAKTGAGGGGFLKMAGNVPAVTTAVTA